MCITCRKKPAQKLTFEPDSLKKCKRCKRTVCKERFDPGKETCTTCYKKMDKKKILPKTVFNRHLVTFATDEPDPIERFQRSRVEVNNFMSEEAYDKNVQMYITLDVKMNRMNQDGIEQVLNTRFRSDPIIFLHQTEFDAAYDTATAQVLK